MITDRRIDRIIEQHLTALLTGRETISSILEQHPQYADELRPRLEAILWLVAARNNLEPRPGFISSTRKHIEQQFAAVQPRGFWQRIFRRYTPQRWIFNFAAPVILILMLALIINSLVLSAQLAIPGDPLYSTKLVLESVRSALTFNQLTRTDLSIQFSRERTTELVELVLEGDYELLPTAAARMETQMIASIHSIDALPPRDQPEEQQIVADLRESLSNEIIMLDLLQGTTPPSAHQGIELAIHAAQSGLMALR